MSRPVPLAKAASLPGTAVAARFHAVKLLLPSAARLLARPLWTAPSCRKVLSPLAAGKPQTPSPANKLEAAKPTVSGQRSYTLIRRSKLRKANFRIAPKQCLFHFHRRKRIRRKKWTMRVIRTAEVAYKHNAILHQQELSKRAALLRRPGRRSRDSLKGSRFCRNASAFPGRRNPSRQYVLRRRS